MRTFWKTLLLLILFSGANFTCAQQTIFNVPSADVVPEDVLFLEHESQFRAWEPNSFWLGTHYSELGLGHNTCFASSLFNLNAENNDNLTLGLGFKSAMPIKPLSKKFSKLEPKFTVGSEVLIGLTGNGVGNWSYGHLSARLPKLNTRITGGASFGTTQIFGNTTISFIGGIEQPITKKLEIIADWYSGNDHNLGLFTAGLKYKIAENTHIYLGYQIPNSPKTGTSGIVVEFSKFFDLKQKEN